MSETVVKQIVIPPLAQQSENAGEQFGQSEEADLPTPHNGIRQRSSTKTSEAHTSHERRNYSGCGVKIGAAKNGQHALPGDLIQEGGKAGEKVDGQKRENDCEFFKSRSHCRQSISKDACRINPQVSSEANCCLFCLRKL